jgi:hypothetical protein
MDFSGSKFFKNLKMMYGYKHKIKVRGYDLDGNKVFESPETLFTVDEQNTITVDLYQTYGVIYALEVINFNLIKGEDIIENNITKTPFSVSPQIVFPFNDMPESDTFDVSLSRVSDGEIIFQDIIMSEHLQKSHIFQTNSDRTEGYVEHRNIDSNFSDYSNDTFLFSVKSPYSDISSYGNLFTVIDGINGVLRIPLLKDFSITQNSSTVEITLYLEDIEGIDIDMIDSNYEWSSTVENSYTFNFSKDEVLESSQLDFTIEGVIRIANRKMFSQYSIVIPDVQVQNSNYMEEK